MTVQYMYSSVELTAKNKEMVILTTAGSTIAVAVGSTVNSISDSSF